MLIQGYCQGLFPMAHSREGPIQWYSADPRGILPLDGFHVPKSLARRCRNGRFKIVFDRDLEAVIRACSLPRPGAEETWISDSIIQAYVQLHYMGLAHSVEALLPDPATGENKLVGGLYGVSLGGVFFGESMFSTDASKVCLVRLVEHLSDRGYALLDTQMVTGDMP